jgi:hypothetical protein
MPSRPPSIYHRQARVEEGPFLILVDDSFIYEDESTGRCVNVYFTNVPEKDRTGNYTRRLLLTICDDHISIFPVVANPTNRQYLHPKYGSLQEIIVTRSEHQPYVLPQTLGELEDLLRNLPKGLETDFRLGLGLKWEYRHLCKAISDLGDVTCLILDGSENCFYEPPKFVIPVKHFLHYQREQQALKRRFRKTERAATQRMARDLLLSRVFGTTYPPSTPYKNDAVSKLLSDSLTMEQLTKRDRHSVIRFITKSVPVIGDTSPAALLKLHADIEIATLESLLKKFDSLFNAGKSESSWQKLFKDYPLILSFAFSVPVMLLYDQPYVGGKAVNGRGGKYADFLFKTASTGNVAIMEIKTPDMPLLEDRPFRGNDVFPISSALSRAISQALAQRHALQSMLPVLKAQDPAASTLHDFGIRCYVVAGRMPIEHNQRKSFELLRNSLFNVSVVTFDELSARLRQILSLLNPIEKNDHDIPF